MLVKLSATKVGTWLDCPRKYFFSYVARQPRTRSWAHLSYGNAVHGALREWFDLPMGARKAERVPALVDAAWSDAGFEDESQAAHWRETATTVVREYLAGLPAAFEPMSTERNLAFKTDSFIMEGRIDRLDEHEAEVAVVDYKTGKSVPSNDEVRGSTALAMYALMVQRTLNRACFDVSLHHVPSGSKVSWRHTPRTLHRHLERIGAIAVDIDRAQDTWESTDSSDAVRDELFPPRPGRLCGYCDYWDICPAGQQSAQRRESWAGLESPEAGSAH
jgi:RecB family exonuclease